MRLGLLWMQGHLKKTLAKVSRPCSTDSSKPWQGHSSHPCPYAIPCEAIVLAMASHLSMRYLP